MDSKPITYLIVDQDENTIRLLDLELKEFKSDLKSLGTFRCYKEANSHIIKQEPNIIFIDIQFPFFSGAEFFGKAKQRNSDFIFLANDDNFIFQNIKASRFDCLLRPISRHELRRTLKRKVEARKLGRTSNYGLYSPASTEYKFKKLYFPTSNGFVFINPDEIIYCQADLEYTRIVTSTDKHLISKNLKHFENVLNGRRFVRCHKSYLVNIDHIKLYMRSDGGQLILSNDKLIPIGRSKKSVFSQLLGV